MTPDCMGIADMVILFWFFSSLKCRANMLIRVIYSNQTAFVANGRFRVLSFVWQLWKYCCHIKKKKLNRDPPSPSLSPLNLFNHCTVFPWMLSVGGLVSGAPAPAPLWFRHGENERPSENTAAAVQSTSVGRWHYSLLRVITTHFGGEKVTEKSCLDFFRRVEVMWSSWLSSAVSRQHWRRAVVYVRIQEIELIRLFLRCLQLCCNNTDSVNTLFWSIMSLSFPPEKYIICY